jgi:hypothetical protein
LKVIAFIETAAQDASLWVGSFVEAALHFSTRQGFVDGR